jgi:hypothetical protein
MPQNEARTVHPIRASTTLKKRIGVWAYRRIGVTMSLVMPQQDADTPIRRYVSRPPLLRQLINLRG